MSYISALVRAAFHKPLASIPKHEVLAMLDRQFDTVGLLEMLAQKHPESVIELLNQGFAYRDGPADPDELPDRPDDDPDSGYEGVNPTGVTPYDIRPYDIRIPVWASLAEDEFLKAFIRSLCSQLGSGDGEIELEPAQFRAIAERAVWDVDAILRERNHLQDRAGFHRACYLLAHLIVMRLFERLEDSRLPDQVWMLRVRNPEILHSALCAFGPQTAEAHLLYAEAVVALNMHESEGDTIARYVLQLCMTMRVQFGKGGVQSRARLIAPFFKRQLQADTKMAHDLLGLPPPAAEQFAKLVDGKTTTTQELTDEAYRLAQDVGILLG